MKPLPFEQARQCVIETVAGCLAEPPVETVVLGMAVGRVLARDLLADRPYPPRPRSIRDGYAVQAADFPGSVRIAGEVRAGQDYTLPVRRGEAVEIMTGAPVPDGADAVIMVEHATRDGDSMVCESRVQPGNFIVPQGAESETGDVVLRRGTRIDFGHIAAAATIGCSLMPVYEQREVAIIATGDELVSVERQPAPHQIRNSNAHSLAAQVARAGGRPRILPVARDDLSQIRGLVEQGLSSDLLLLSGGVSAGKYDLVERVLADMGAEFFFDRVLIQPGQPLVFGRIGDRLFFGLPGNPTSTMVTFEIFARAALELLGGRSEAGFPVVFARLSEDFHHKPGLTRFLPARVSAAGREVTPLKWQGSGDVFAVAAANAFLMVREDRESWQAGDFIEVLLR